MRRINVQIIKTVFKTAFCLCMTVIVTLGVMRLFGNRIVSSANAFVFGNPVSGLLFKLPPTSNTPQSGFEDDFLTFTGIAETETDTAPVTAQSDGGSIAVNLSALSGKYKNYDGTSVINNTKYDVTGLLYKGYTKPELNKTEPYILIYHTHTSEEYSGGGSVLDAGEAMKSEFERLGYKTVHLTEYYDREQFSGSYSRSIKGVEAVLEKYPTIKLVFDVHRDAITTAEGVVYRPVTEIDGENVAQVMFVCGTDAKGLKHPDWRENFKFALDVSRTMGRSYGALSRPVNLRGDRFNTHVTRYAFLMEIGSVANTVSEARLAAVCTARAVISTVEKD